jgi:hypothetical protein
MAGKECRGNEKPAVNSLPAQALELIVKTLSAKCSCLRTSRQLRDAVLAASKSICLVLNNHSHPTVHQPLLRRACSTAAAGLKVVLKSAATARWSSQRDVLQELLQPFTQEESMLVNVHSLELKVCWEHKEHNQVQEDGVRNGQDKSSLGLKMLWTQNAQPVQEAGSSPERVTASKHARDCCLGCTKDIQTIDGRQAAEPAIQQCTG